MEATAPAVLRDSLADHYTLERELGRGGMATVYLARDLKHGRPVALKVLRPELAAALGADRFLREIRLTANLQHLHILPLLDSGEAAGQLFYVMPYVEGESLRQRLTRDRQLPVAEALQLTAEIAEALDYAHKTGIIHRDVKPENILLSRGHALVADFGIGLAMNQADGGRLTETGLSLGTPCYMSPEQAMAEARLDGRSDQYSLACVLYEMLTGEPPYSGSNAQAILAKRMREPIPRLSVLREVPAQVEEAVTRALARVPADRFESVGEFADALTKPAAARRFKKSYAMGSLVAGLVIVGLAGLLSRSLTPGAPATLSHRQVTFTGRASAPALSPNQQWLAFASGGQLFIQDLRSAGVPVAVGHGPFGPFVRPRWSPDGEQLYYVAYDSSGFGIHVVPRAGGASRRLATGARFDVAPVGHVLYATRGRDSVIVLDARSGAQRGAFALGPLASSVFSPTVSPDSRWVAFTGVDGSVTFLGLCRTDGSGARRLVDGVPRWGSLGWSPAGNAIYYLRDAGSGANVTPAGDVMKVSIDPESGEPSGEPVTVLGGASVQEFSLSADGRQLAYTKAPPQQRIWAITLEGPTSHPTVRARELTMGTSIYGTPDVSPDGRWVAFGRNEGGTGNLYLTPFERFEPRPLAATPADEWSPRFSPDGRQVAYAVRDSGSPGILVVEVATGQVRRVASDGLAPLGVIAWMPNGREVVFPLDLGRHYAIVDIASGGADTLVAPDSVVGFHLTVPEPTGRELVVSAPGGMWVVKRSGEPVDGIDTGELFALAPLRWTADGWLYFLSSATTLARVRPGTGKGAVVATLPQPCSDWQTSLSADARRLVCVVSHTEPDIWIAENFDPETR